MSYEASHASRPGLAKAAIFGMLEFSARATGIDSLCRDLCRLAAEAGVFEAGWMVDTDADGNVTGSSIAGDASRPLTAFQLEIGQEAALSGRVVMRVEAGGRAETPEKCVWAVLPVFCGETPRALLFLSSAAPDFLDTTTMRLLTALQANLSATVLRLTEQERMLETESQLRASEKRFRVLVQSLGEGVGVVDLKERFVFVNPAAERIFGVENGTLVGRCLVDLVPPGEFELLLANTEKRRHGITSAYEHRIIRQSDGAIRDLIITASPQYDAQGLHTGNFATFRDITDSKEIEREILANQVEQARLTSALDQAGESIIITDVEGAIQYVNPALEKISQYSREEVIGRNPRILKSGQHSTDFFKVMWETLLRGETWSGTLINKRKDGTLYNTVTTISPVKTPDGTIMNFVAVSRDVTAELLLRDQLNHSQKMESVGRLAGGIAHDFNNLLMIIQTYTELLQSRLPQDETLRGYSEQILKAAERGRASPGRCLPSAAGKWSLPWCSI